jgi:hypothetical protein
MIKKKVETLQKNSRQKKRCERNLAVEEKRSEAKKVSRYMPSLKKT